MDTESPKRSIWYKLSFRNWRIGTKLLVVMLVISLVPLLLAMLLVVRSSTEALTNSRREALSLLGNSVALRFSNLLLDSRNLLQVTASNPAIAGYLEDTAKGGAPTPPDLVQEAFANLQKANPQIDVVGLYNPDAVTMAHTDPALLGKNVAFRDFVSTALQGGDFNSGLRRDLVNDAPGMNFAVPVIEDGAVIGAMAIHIKDSYFTDVLSETLGSSLAQATSNKIAMYLVNANGIVMGQTQGDELLYRSLGVLSPEQVQQVATHMPLGGACPADQPQCKPTEKIARQPETVPALQALGDQVRAAFAAGQAGNLRFCRPTDPNDVPANDACNGEWQLGAYTPVALVDSSAGAEALPAQQFMVLIDIPERSFMALIEQQRLFGTMHAGLMALLAIIGSWWLARLIAKPINRLAATAADVEREQPYNPQSIAAVMTQGDEIGHLARVFSRMVLSLQARVADLRTIYDVGRSISASIDLEDTLKFVADSIRGVIPYDAAEISLLDADERNMMTQYAVGGEPLSAEAPVYAAYQGLIGRVVTIGDGVLVPHLASAPETREEPTRTWQVLQPRAYLGVPLKVQAKTIGVIELVSRQVGGFSEDNLRLLTSIAAQAAIALQNARAVRTRENQYKQQIQELHIEIDEMKRSQQVGEIVESEYFQRLSSQAQRLRSNRSKGPSAP